MLFRSRINHCDEELWHITAHDPPPQAPRLVRVGGGDGIPQHFVIVAGSTSKKHHRVTTIDGDGRVMLFRSRINNHEEELWHITSVDPTTRTPLAGPCQ